MRLAKTLKAGWPQELHLMRQLDYDTVLDEHHTGTGNVRHFIRKNSIYCTNQCALVPISRFITYKNTTRTVVVRVCVCFVHCVEATSFESNYACMTYS